MTLALVLAVPASEVELASDILWSLGVAAVEERTPDDVEEGYGEGFVELWTSLGTDPEAVVRQAEALPARWRWRVVELDPAVAESWRQHATPTWIEDDLVIVPAWLDEHGEHGKHGEPGVLRVDIDPGAAFGLGDHPTTVLTLRLLRASWWPGATVLDVGCGSGVLSVVAARLGAPYVRAVDVSAAAVEATRRNAERNGVGAVVDVDSTPLAALDDTFDVVLANVLAPALIAMAADLRRVVQPAGVLVVSGVLDGAHAHVLEALAPLQPVETLTRDGWAAIALRH